MNTAALQQIYIGYDARIYNEVLGPFIYLFIHKQTETQRGADINVWFNRE